LLLLLLLLANPCCCCCWEGPVCRDVRQEAWHMLLLL
jgi:hypothetical protein